MNTCSRVPPILIKRGAVSQSSPCTLSIGTITGFNFWACGSYCIKRKLGEVPVIAVWRTLQLERKKHNFEKCYSAKDDFLTSLLLFESSVLHGWWNFEGRVIVLFVPELILLLFLDVLRVKIALLIFFNYLNNVNYIESYCLVLMIRIDPIKDWYTNCYLPDDIY